jgi:predicted TPR repeat methyltransferase
MNTGNERPDNAKPQTAPASSPGARRDMAQKLFDRAVQNHRAGRLKEAQSGYREVVQIMPGHADALHMLGVLAYQAGKNDEAISLIERAGKRMAPNAGVCINLGNALQASGRLNEAASAFRQAIGIDPGYAIAYNNLGNALRQQGKLEAAVAAFKKALDIDDRYADACVNLAITLQSWGDIPDAIRLYERAVALDPAHESAAHMLAALRGEVSDAAPRGHVTRLFDEYASRFDRHLVETLGYSMPWLMRGEIDRLLGKDTHFSRVIDLGCGTGLAGVTFRPLSGFLAGADLSPRMIDRARERNLYDELQVGDVVTVLKESRRRYDLFVCADVFPYIGNVEPLFSAVASHAEAGALFVLSTELCSGDGFMLRASGRYAHSQNYLRDVAIGSGFSITTMRTENLRKQKDYWTPGDLIVLQYRV